jgi:hypothetical protein
MWPGLIRLMLEQSTAQAAVDVLSHNLPNAGRNFIIADRDRAFDYETTGRRVNRLGHLSADRFGHLVHTNHYLGVLKETEITARLGPTTGQRLAALESFFAAHPIDQLTGDIVRRAFFESGALCDCVNLRSPADANATATCGGLAVDHGARKAYAFRGRFGAETTITWDV